MNAIIAMLASLLTAAAPAGVTVTGTVQDGDRRPVAQHPVELKSTTGKASFYGVTDAKGNYSFYDIPAGSYQLQSVKQQGAKVDVIVGAGGKGLPSATLTLPASPPSSAPPLRLAAEAHDTGKRYGLTSKGMIKYDFKFWLEGSPAVLSSIQKVDYKLTYASKSLRRTVDAANTTRAFAANYIGWGCYEDVSAVITHKDGKSETKHFDMCVSLGWD